MRDVQEQIEAAIMSAIDGRHDATEWFTNPDESTEDTGPRLVDRLMGICERYGKNLAAEVNRRRGEMAVAREYLQSSGIATAIDGVTLTFGQRLKIMRAQRDAWRKAALMLFASCQEGGSRGRPMDVMAASDWNHNRSLVTVAELIEQDQKMAMSVAPTE